MGTFLFSTYVVICIICGAGIVYMNRYSQDFNRVKRGKALRILKETSLDNTDRYYLQVKCFFGMWHYTLAYETVKYFETFEDALRFYNKAFHTLEKKRTPKRKVTKSEVVFPTK